MAITPSSRVSKAPKKSKGGTPSTRHHHFESFTQRIAKLNIDPISRSRRTDISQDDLESTTSHFKVDLLKWKDLNLSESFTKFVQEVESLCETLPQILHHQDKIADILFKYLEKGETLSLEPLLALTASFAHDLGTRFEKHFGRALELVTGVAASHPDVEVIEFSFSCLAWLFKFLSRLLVPDLRPTYDIMAPLLGRSHHKPHVARFSAEALSFLIRKAASGFHKNQVPLNLILSHSIQDLCEFSQSGQDPELYCYGLMNLYSNAAKGVNGGLHSSAVTICKCLIECEADFGSLKLVPGVFVNIIHHSDSSTFAPLFEMLTESIQLLDTGTPVSKLRVFGELLFLCVSTRKGSRVSDWRRATQGVDHLQRLQTAESSNLDPNFTSYKAAACVFQYAPLDIVIPNIRRFMDLLASTTSDPVFLSFCVFFRKLGRERFQNLLMPYFFKFISAYQPESESSVIEISLQVFMSGPTLQPIRGSNAKAMPEPWSERILHLLDQEPNLDSLPLLNGYLDLLDVIPALESRSQEITEALIKMVSFGLNVPVQPNTMMRRFACGRALGALLHNKKALLGVPNSTWIQLFGAGKELYRMPRYLENLRTLWQCVDIGAGPETIFDAVHQNLMSPCTRLRQSSLLILSEVFKKAFGTDSDALELASIIEETPLNLQSARVISMHIRKFPRIYKNNEGHPLAGRMVVYYLFGVLNFQLSPIWNDAIEALKMICESKEGETLVSDLTFLWLKLQRELDDSDEPNATSNLGSKLNHVNEFQCTNAESLQAEFRSSLEDIQNAEDRLEKRLQLQHEISPSMGSRACIQALRVLKAIPWLAEKRSRQWTPYFGIWMGQDDSTERMSEESLNDDDANNFVEVEHRKFFKHEQRALLELLGAFKNPSVLYQSEKVFNTLLKVLESGDPEVQKLSLKAIFTWNLGGVKPYQTNLLNLVDDARFREELSVFLQTEDSDGLQVEHKPELMPVLLRLLYGKVTSKSSAQGSRRRAMFDCLARFEDSDIEAFLDIALGPLRYLPSYLDKEDLPGSLKSILTPRKQLGLLNMIKDMIDVFGHRLIFLIPKLASCLLHIVSNAVTQISDIAEPEDQSQNDLNVHKDIRSAGLNCFDSLYARCFCAELELYTASIYDVLISSRLERLPIEMAQGISGLLKLFSTWATNAESACYLLILESSLLDKVTDIINVPSAKDGVKLFVVNNILKPLIHHAVLSSQIEANRSPSLTTEMLEPHIEHVLTNAGILLEATPSKSLLSAMIELVSSISGIASGSSQNYRLLEISGNLLNQPTARVPSRVKSGLLKIIAQLLPSSSLLDEKDLFDRLFVSVSMLFKYVKDRETRTQLCAVFQAFAGFDKDLSLVAELCEGVNAFSLKVLDEPDFDRRLKSFTDINDTLYRNLSERQWTPILSNLIFYVQDEDELAIRSSAAFGLRRFIDSCCLQQDPLNPDTPSWKLVNDSLLPALKDGATVRSELVRSEILTVMAHLVQSFRGWDPIKDMLPLLVNDDEEASFFNNVLHVQQHRRLRALRRLANEANDGKLRSTNVAHFFIPLIEHFIFELGDKEGAHNLRSEAVQTTGALASCLEWPQLRALVKRYASYISTKPEMEKTVIRVLGLLVDAIVQAASRKHKDSLESDQIMIDSGSTTVTALPQKSTLVMTMPWQDKLSDDLTKNLLPSLTSYLRNKDESTVSLRVPVAVSAVKILKILPEKDLAARLPPLLTDVCHILRSRAQESRDLTRKTLVEISSIIGPEYLGFVLKELRASLARGYQLHVLSFTVHSILVETSDVFKPGELDYCLPQIVAIIMDDVFGATGQEKDAEDYISKMKEVKSNKSFDSMELLAKKASITRIAPLIRPLQALLDEKLDLRTVKKVDDLLRRIGHGMLRNEAVESQETLIACYEIVQWAYKSVRTTENQNHDPRIKRFLINAKGAKFGHGGQTTSSFRYKLTRFAFDLLRMVLRKYESLKTPANLSGFIPAISDALLESHEEVQMSALRLIAEIIQLNIPELERNATVYISEAVKIIKNAVSTNSEISQAALKLVTAVLRERQKAAIKDTDIGYLLKKVQDDLDEADRQGVSFNFLKAVLQRKVVIVEVYEIMDSIAAMMVTSQSKTTRDMARGSYFDFLMNFPHSKNRLSKQISFLAKNLDYKHEEGRKSVMEAMHRLLVKAPDELLEDASKLFFVPLVLVTVNDESSDCRRMAVALLRTILENSQGGNSRNMLDLMKSWLSQDQPLLIRAALQLYGVLDEVDRPNLEKELPTLQTRMIELLKTYTASQDKTSWEVLYYDLQLLSKLIDSFPSRFLAANMEVLWNFVRQTTTYPHSWVKFAASKVVGLHFADIARYNAQKEELDRPLKGSNGLELQDDVMIFLMKAFLRNLKTATIGEDLAIQLARNLVFLGQFLPETATQRPSENDWNASESEASDTDDKPVAAAEEPPLLFMFQRLSAIVRREPVNNKSQSLAPKTTALQICASLVNKLHLPSLKRHMKVLLLPLLQITDKAFVIPFSTDKGFKDSYNSIISMSHEILGALQKRVGTSEYVKEVAAVQSEIKSRREERRVKRRLERISEPEKVAKQKKRKIEREKIRRKEKIAEFRGRRRGW